MNVKQTYAQFLAQCEHGFTSEHHHRAWFLKHREAIFALPRPLREAVLRAHEQATAVEFSK